MPRRMFSTRPIHRNAITDNGCRTSLANKHFLKVADLAALESDYYKSITNYERIGRQSINNNLMKWSVKDYLLKAGICHLATKVRDFTLFFDTIAHFKLGSCRDQPGFRVIPRARPYLCFDPRASAARGSACGGGGGRPGTVRR